MENFALFDANMTVVRDAKDISPYVAESIRNIYGMIVEVDLKKYPGLSSKEVAIEVLREHGLKEDEIDERLDRYLEDLPYSYYNVAWSDKILVMDGAKQFLENLKKKDVVIGIATGEPQRVSKMRLDKVGMSSYFTFGSYAEDGLLLTDILAAAMDKATAEHGLQPDQGFFFSSLPRFVAAAKEVGLYSIGVATGGFGKDELKAAGADEAISSLKDRPKRVSSV